MEIAVRNDSIIYLVDKIKNGDEKEVKIAQTRFYKIFAGYVYKLAVQSCSNFVDPNFLAKEVVQNTFIKAFDYLPNFTFKSGIKDEEANKIIKALLGQIGNKVLLNTIAEYINEKRCNKKIEIEELKIFENEDEELNVQPISNIFMKKLQSALNDLKEKDKHIVLTYAAEDCIDNTRHISENAMEFLCSAHKTTSANIRQRKKRALDKIKSKCFEETK
ncbi:sigma-70 family RNA polymerase sigma factor [Mariniphaga sediminis]|uniref:Sigma-70 family RNA polymerase sigma factor n=1 Tax=Mariniphaga sediminis TaxID=1628158 RepID=A0A399D4T0_9BACT|nr:sigma-70 family RNA polymerase sigma factor [Mariniphaga sediminis]RIH66188.1 sigma-70 family RNA polymerase sigma factor [Mariniphaga sediminis]